MADNVTLNPGAAGSVIRTLDRTSVETQIVALDLNPAGSETLMAGAMPCSQSGTWNVGTLATITNSVTVVNAGTFAVQASQSGTWSVNTKDGSGNSLTSLLTGSQRPLTVAVLDASGNQITSFGGSGGTASNYGSAFPSTGTASGYTDGTDMQAGRVFDLDSGAGTQYVIGVGLRLSSSGGSVEAGTGTNPIRIDPTGTTTQPVSGTVTANIGTSGSLALDATLTGGTQKTKLVDTGGTNVATVSVAGALKVDGSAVTQPISGTVTANAGTGTFTVSGAVTQSGTWNIGTLTSVTNVVHVDDNSGSLTVDNAGTFAVQAAQSGTWNVGTVTTVSAVTSITNALPAGTNILGIVSACDETNTIFNGTTPLTPKFAAITASASGDTSIVSAVTGKKIRVMRWSVSSSGTVNIKWRNGTTDITGLYYMVANATVGGGYCPVGHFETSSNSALQINLSGATAVGGVLTYIEV